MWRTLGGLLLLLWVSSCAMQEQMVFDEKWLDVSVAEQVQAIKTGQITSEQLVSAYLDRISAIDDNGPAINSILALNPNALAEARNRDLSLKEGKAPGLLHGIPVLLKDNIETADQPTTAGSLALIANDTRRDAPLVANLRKAGAVILGKTNLSEWANFRSEDSISGWSAVGGLTRNPHVLSRTACGSSSGSGAAMAVGLASLAVGTETNGSVICPSSMNGIVGFKPTVGLISRTHVVPISVTQDTAGPMTRSVKDAALMASVMASVDENDEATIDSSRPEAAELTNLNGDIKRMRIGVMRYRQGNNAAVIAAFDKGLEKLKSLGAELVEITDMEQPKDYWQQSYFVLLAEFKTTLNQYLLSSPANLPVRNLGELIGFNRASKAELQLFDQRIFELSEATEGMQDERYEVALNTVREASRTNGIDKLLHDYDVEVLVAPSNNPAFLIDAVYGDNAPAGYAGVGYLAAIAGYPHITVPLANVKDLPVGFSVMSGKWQDAKVLNVGYAFEQANQHLSKPQFYHSRFDEKALHSAEVGYSKAQ